MDVICPQCSFYFAVEISGRRQQTDCPQCGEFAGSPDREGGLMVKCICKRCGLGHPVDATAKRIALGCPGCGAVAKRRDRNLIRRLADVYRLRRSSPAPENAASDGPSRVNLDEMEIDAELLSRVPTSIAFAYNCVPIRYEKDVLTVALTEPVKKGVLEDLALVLRCTVQGASAPRVAINRALRRHYGPEGAEPSA